MRQLLSGIKVVELAEGIAGSYCGKLFADLGADVVKVEASAATSCATGRAPPATRTACSGRCLPAPEHQQAQHGDRRRRRPTAVSDWNASSSGATWSSRRRDAGGSAPGA